MNHKNYDVPILFVIFNRPDTASKVFSKIREIKPSRLFIAADGPRSNRSGEDEKCQQTRDIIKDVDWKCEVQTLFRDKNLGCKKAVSGAITWFFSQVDEGVILEDDCLPDISFFTYIKEMLEKYRNDTRVGMISGDNFFGKKIDINSSYYFSKYPHIWGWGSWKRVWDKYDPDMKSWPKVKNSKEFSKIFNSLQEKTFWSTIFETTYKGNLDTWDFQFTYLLWINRQMSIIPSVNLISNIGFNQDATHTIKDSPVANLPVESMKFPIKDPENYLVNETADAYVSKQQFRLSFLSRSLLVYKRIFSKKV